MKKLLLSTAALALLGGAAAAADLPAFEPAPVVAPVPQAFTWTGPYAGLAAGYAWGEAEVNDFEGDDDDDDGDEEFDADGWLVGGFVGYNYQFPSALVIGIEADLDWTGIDGDDNGDGDNGDDDDDDDDDGHFNADLDWEGSLRARLGYGFDRALLYATGGIALAGIDAHSDGDGDDDDDDNDGDNTEWGWTLGAGVDFAVTDNVFVRGEYRFTNYSDFNNEDDEGEAQDFRTHAVRLGVGVLF